MHRIPLTAKAECADGPTGGLSGLVVRADNRALEYFVVRDTAPGMPVEHLVPRARVDVDAEDQTTIHLSCTRDELDRMPSLNVREYALTGPPKSGSAGSRGIVDSERAPDGTGVLRLSQKVEASNGAIGTLSGVITDDDGQITHFFTRLDSRGNPELFLPVSAVYYVDRTSVYLRLDKHQVESLPSVPVDKAGTPAHKHMKLVARVYETPTGASEALDTLNAANLAVTIREAVVLVREGDAAARVQTKKGKSSGGKGIAMGVAAGGLLAMLGPIGLVAGVVGGGAVGGLTGSRVELGFPDAFLKGLQARLQPNHSALVLLLEYAPDQDPASLDSVLDGAISQETLVESLVQEMLATEQTPVAAGG